jgi:hypothetical protein
MSNEKNPLLNLPSYERERERKRQRKREREIEIEIEREIEECKCKQIVWSCSNSSRAVTRCGSLHSTTVERNLVDKLVTVCLTRKIPY